MCEIKNIFYFTNLSFLFNGEDIIKIDHQKDAEDFILSYVPVYDKDASVIDNIKEVANKITDINNKITDALTSTIKPLVPSLPKEDNKLRTDRYHVYQPVYITDPSSVERDKKNEELPLPVFYLKMLDDKIKWENLIKALFLILDAATIASGIGILSKFRYLRYLSTAEKVFSIFVGTLEIGVGSLNILLNIAEEDKYPKFCQKLRIVLLVIELSSAALAEAVIKPALKKYAAEALDEFGRLNRYLQETEEMARAKQQLEAIVTPERYPAGVPEEIGDDLYVLRRNGDEIFRGTKKEADEFAEQLKKALDDNPYKNVDELIYATKMKIADKMWKEYKYLNFLDKPPKKPCFLAGTLIHTKTGLVPIEKIAIGMEVLCYDEIKQTTTSQKVSETFTNKAEKYIIIHTQSGDKISATGQHLFYQKLSKTWVKAHALAKGMFLYNAINNSLDAIVELEIIEKNVPTYNFEVPIHHNYLVGNAGLLTHNASKFKTVDDLTTRKYQFYELFTRHDNTTHYIGKTTRESLDIRNAEHKYTAMKKGPKSKDYWKVKLDPSISNLNQGAYKFVEMTEIQSAVWEKYFLEKYRFETGSALKNIQNPIGESRFNALKASGKHKNVCIFFI